MDRYKVGSPHSNRLHHASFVLRCWVTSRGEVRARLVDVRTGISHPLSDLADLAALTRRLLMWTESALVERGDQKL